MRPSVLVAVPGFTAFFEGFVDCMYPDCLGLITVGMGCKIDPVEEALGLPFVHKDWRPASQEEIATEWRMMHDNRKELAIHGWHGAKKIATLHLSVDDINALFMARLLLIESHLKARFSAYESWPADAQLGLLSMGYAMGPNFHFPHFEAFANALDFAQAAIQSHMDDSHNPGLRPRNAANAILFNNAAIVLAIDGDAETLHYPDRLMTDDTLPGV